MTPADLNKILFQQLERLQNADADNLDSEIQRSKSVKEISEQVISNNNMRLNAVRLIADYKGLKNIDGAELPQNLIG